MIRRPPRSTLSSSSAASDVYKRQEATRAHGPEQPGDSEWDQGYGYQFWRGQHGTYRSDGAFAQLGIVLPDQDAVIAITAGAEDKDGLFERIWTHLLPALAEGRQQVRPDPLEQAVLVLGACRDRDHGVLVGQHDAQLGERPVGPVGAVLPTPELVPVALVP